MGEVKWLAHSPEDVNPEARRRVEELTRHDSSREEIELSSFTPTTTTTIRASSGWAALFVIVIITLLVATLVKL